MAPGLSEIGKVVPTSEKPVPETEAEEIATAEVPVDESVTDCVVGEPSVTVPKLRAVVLSPSLGLCAATPVPLNVTTELVPDAELLLMVREPLAVAAVRGANVICRVRD